MVLTTIQLISQVNLLRARSFDALTDYISVGTTGMSAASGSVEAWANTNSAAGPTGESYIFGHTTPPYSGPDYHDRIQLYLKSSTNQLALGLGEGAGGHDIKTNIAILANGAWYHVVLNWDGTNYEVFVTQHLQGYWNLYPTWFNKSIC